MSLSMVSGPTFVVPISTANSQAAWTNSTIGDSDVIGCLSPATLPETANWQVSPDYDPASPSSATWVDADSTNAPMGTAGLYKIFNTSALLGLAVRVHLNGNAAAARTFRTVKRQVI